MLDNGTYKYPTTFTFDPSVVGPYPDPGANSNPKDKDAKEQKEIKRLRSQHPMYKLFAPEWQFYLDAYEGGKDFANGDNLFKHLRESQKDFDNRADRIHYINHCEPLVSFFTNFLFSETIQRDGGDDNDWYQNFLLNVNKKGDNITEFMKDVEDNSQIFGMVYVLADTPNIPFEGVELTKAREEELGLDPYWIMIKPEEVLDWKIDQFERPMYIKRFQCVFEDVGSGWQDYEKYSEWYTDHIQITHVDNTDPQKPFIASVQQFRNALGLIPIVAFRYKRSKKYPYLGMSFLKDFAYNSREVMNLTSLLQEFLYRQCFNILAKETEQFLPFKDQSEGIVSEANVMEVPKGVTHMPQYISPPSEPARFIQEERSRIINEMFKRAAQDSMNELFNGEAKSGFSQAQSFSKTVPYISSRADVLEKGENDLMKLTMFLRSKQWKGKIKYKDRYELTNITDAITQLTMLFKDWQMPSETFVKEEMKRIIHEMDGKLPPDTMTKIEAEIDAMDWGKWQETQKAALIGLPKPTSPSAQQKDKSSGTMAEAAAESNNQGGATNKIRANK